MLDDLLNISNLKKGSAIFLISCFNLIVYISLLLITGHSTNSGFLSLKIEALFIYGESYPFYIRYHLEVYRLMTSLFLHKNLLHFLTCFIFHIIFGQNLEILTKSNKIMIIIYLLSGIAGNMVQNIYSIKPISGSSPAIFGMLGAQIGISYLKRRKYLDNTLNSKIIRLLSIGVLFNFLIANAFQGSIIYGHLGGLIYGILISIAIKKINDLKLIKKDILLIKITRIFLLLSLITLILLFFTINQPSII